MLPSGLFWRSFAFVLALWLALPALPGAAQEQSLALEPLAIDTASGLKEFSVEVARSPEERAIGLMNRAELAPDRGMLFDFGEDRVATIWMKNTLISLDILFVEKNGRIVRIAEEAEPLSEAIISSGHPVRSVLELLGGTAQRLGIMPGDRIRHPLFGTSP